ncbi:isopenicillin N synthase family oxygenase [Pseudooceanicola sp. GBMRC 2024]|uniref:2-oxoglutarate-dependent ethylene/succinate-forming enzyme n=2 Tax=Paracoccaceae TaxID=31989 RepID=A0A6L7G7I4_9RHOB|nr:isopenicillin N synthase family oxygenase [Pseudooceanicola albus]
MLQTGNGTRTFKSAGLEPNRVPFDSLPVIDLAPIFGTDEEARQRLAAELRRACTEVGFFYIRNHAVPQAVIDGAFGAAQDFFARPDADKQAIHVSKSRNNRGYAALLEENTDPTARGDLHESFDIALEVPETDPDVLAGKNLYGPNLWPEGAPAFRGDVEAYYDAMITLSRNLLHAFALALDLPEDHFDTLVSKPLATLRLLHYPPQFGEIDDRQIGIGAHSDYECFTILAQDDIHALQALNANGEWISAPPLPGHFVVNIGDQMARWTNGLFASTVHRAINRSGKERYSIPFFFGPNYDAEITPLESCVDADHPAQFEPITSGAYINSRFEATFAGYAAQNKAED